MLSKFRKKILNIVKTLAITTVTAIIISFVLTFALQHIESTQIEYLESPTTTIIISNVTIFSPPYEVLVKKSYFDSIGKVYVYLSSPYANCWNIFNVWMSLDNSSWVKVPFLEFNTNNYSQMAFLGVIKFDNPQLKIYQKYYIPPQTITLPPNVTKQDASNFKSNVIIKREATPADRTRWISTFFSWIWGVFSFIGIILTLLLSGKDSNSNYQNIGVNGKKPSRTPNRKKRKNTKFLESLDSNLSILNENITKP